MLGRLLIAAVAALALAGPARADTLRLPDGGEIAYETAGSGERTLILIHGYSFAKEIWDEVVPLIDQEWTVIAYDLRGFGDSSGASAYDHAAMSADLEGLMDALGLGSAVLAGHSLGGIFVQDFASAHPGRVDALVLLNAQARDQPPLGLSDAFRARIDAFGDAAANRAAFEAATPAYVRAENLGAGDMDALLAMNMRAETPALKGAFEHRLTARPLSPEAWARIDMPVLVVAATHDIVPFATAVGLLDSLPQAELAVIARSGHTPMWERPETFAEALRYLSGGALGARLGAQPDRSRNGPTTGPDAAAPMG